MMLQRGWPCVAQLCDSPSNSKPCSRLDNMGYSVNTQAILYQDTLLLV